MREPMAPGFVNRPRGTGDYLLMLFHQDTVVGFPDVHRLEAGPLARIWSEDMGHYYGGDRGEWLHSWIHFDGTLASAAILGSGVAAGAPMTARRLEPIEQFLALMVGEMSTNHPPSAEILPLLLKGALCELARLVAPANPPSKTPPPGVLAAKRHIERHFGTPINLADLASLAGLSVPHFCHLFKKFFGTPPVEYLIRARLDAAARHLADRNKRVSEIAEITGFNDARHFSRLFKKRLGATPREYRREKLGITDNRPLFSS